MKNIKQYFKGFTLVELIIVITILAILATIAFASFQGYTKGARDSNRLTTLQSIKQGIDIYQTTVGTIPMIDDKIGTGTINGNAVTHVGYIGDNVAKLIKLNKTPIDPSTQTRYIYGIDYTQTKYQVATISEDLQTNLDFITQTYADAGVKARVLGNHNGLLKYSGKLYNIPSLIVTFSLSSNQDLLATNTNYIIDKADNLPYLAGQAKIINTLTPTQVLQKLTNTGSALTVTGITLPTDAGTWNSSSGTLQTNLGYQVDTLGQAIFGNNYFITIKTNTHTGGGGGEGVSNYPGCDTPDITIGGYTIAACNVGTNTAGLTATSYGSYFQWGNNGGTPSGILTPNTTLVNASTNGPGNYYNSTTFIGGASLASPYDWTSSQNNNLWGDTTNTSIARQGPCASGYHVPSRTEWSALVTAGGWCVNGCGGSDDLGSAMQIALKLPFAGIRNRYDGFMYNQSTDGNYWTSSPDGSNASGFFSNSSYVNPIDNDNRAHGFSVRCFKN